MRQSDVLIVGAGPAGTWAAYRLAPAGARVKIFDASHPREKPCGGGLTGRALRIVGGALDVDRLPAVPARSLRFESGPAWSEFPLPASGDAPAATCPARHTCPRTGRFPASSPTAGAPLGVQLRGIGP
jgi:2-polyprenyl-6-methoxyphenol hydroxylase-like FAD-dependent oxidoreductase